MLVRRTDFWETLQRGTCCSSIVIKNQYRLQDSYIVNMLLKNSFNAIYRDDKKHLRVQWVIRSA